MKYVPPQEENEILRPPKETNQPKNNARLYGEEMPCDDSEDMTEESD